MVKQYASAGVRILLQRLGLLYLKILDVSNYFEAFPKSAIKELYSNGQGTNWT